MSNLSDGDVLRFTARLRTSDGSDVCNVYTYRVDGSGETLSLALTNVAGVLNAAYDHIQPGIPSDTTFVDISAENLTTHEVTAAQPWPTLTAGGGTGDTMPNQCCGLVVGRTETSKTMGRKFLGPFYEGANADGVWSAGQTTALGDFLIHYLGQVTVGSNVFLKPVVAHVVNGVVSRIADIWTAYTSNQIYTQRRRRPGVGA